MAEWADSEADAVVNLRRSIRTTPEKRQPSPDSFDSFVAPFVAPLLRCSVTSFSHNYYPIKRTYQQFVPDLDVAKIMEAFKEE